MTRARLLLLLGALTLPFSGIESAELRFQQAQRSLRIEFPSTPTCNIQLKGTIVPGDAEKLKRTLEEVEGDKILCLESDGGSYQEGIAIANVLLEALGVTTVIQENAGCFSACAIAFMAGNLVSSKGQFADRWLHATATLSFHSPSLRIPAGIYSEAAVEEAYLHAVRGTRLAMELRREEYGVEVNVVPTSLFTELLSVNHDKVFSVETIDHVGRWGIRLFGIKKLELDPKALPNLFFENLCHNLHSWSEGSQAGGDNALFVDQKREVLLLRKPQRLYVGYRYLAMFSMKHACVMDFSKDERKPHSDWWVTVSWLDVPRNVIGKKALLAFERRVSFPADDEMTPGLKILGDSTWAGFWAKTSIRSLRER